MPSIYANAPEDYEEEKRIFYVAISRSMKHLTFYRPAYDAKGNFTSPSRSEEHTSELQSLMRISYAVFCLKKKKKKLTTCKYFTYQMKLQTTYTSKLYTTTLSNVNALCQHLTTMTDPTASE